MFPVSMLKCTIFVLFGLLFAEGSVSVFSTNNVEEYLKIVLVTDDYILVGGRDHLYNISHFDLNDGKSAISWSASAKALRACESSELWDNLFCMSYVKSAFWYNETFLVVCADSSKTPECRIYQYDSVQNTWKFSQAESDYVSSTLVSVFTWNRVASLQTKNGMIFTALIAYSPDTYNPAIIRQGINIGGVQLNTVSNAMYEDSTFYINYDTDLGILPEFISIFENGEHVYVTFTEPAIETMPRQVLSRIARVCKMDPGNTKQIFTSFYKATISCGTRSHAEAFSARSYWRGNYSINFELADMTSPIASTNHAGQEQEKIFGVFNNPGYGSALCIYGISSIESTFQSSGQLVFDASRPTSINFRQHASNSPNPSAVCSKNSTTANAQTERDSLLIEPIVSENNGPAFILKNPKYTMTQIAVDADVLTQNSTTSTVIFIGTSHGHVLKLVNRGTNYQVVEDRSVSEGFPITEMKLLKSGTEDKFLLINTNVKLFRIPVIDCGRMETCEQCVKSGEPYCSWSFSRSSCLNVQDTDSSSAAEGRTVQCLVTSSSTSTIGPSEMSNNTPETTSRLLIVDQNLVKGPEMVRSESCNENQTILIVLIVILPILTTIIALFVGYTCGKRRSGSSEHSSTAFPNKLASLTKSNSEYQPTKLSNVEKAQKDSILNNSKLANDCSFNNGGDTLQKQKHVYV